MEIVGTKFPSLDPRQTCDCCLVLSLVESEGFYLLQPAEGKVSYGKETFILLS
jgi:hypothetical protein